MMGMPRYPSKVKLKKAIKEGHKGVLDAEREFEETSIYGPEFKGEGTYVVVMGSPTGPRRSFAQVSVNADGIIVGVK